MISLVIAGLNADRAKHLPLALQVTLADPFVLRWWEGNTWRLVRLSTPITSGRHRGAPTLLGDDDALQTEGTEVHSRRMSALQAS